MKFFRLAQAAKKIAAFIFTSFIYLVLSDSLFAQYHIKSSTDTALSTQRDSEKIKTYRITNKKFNEAYLQNLMPSTAGQEFFDPQKTLIVADLTANFVLLNTPKLPVFFVASARVNLRLLADHGDPVKSPSYMPGGTLYFRTNKDAYHPEFLSISYTHHSNGVRGPTLNPDGTFNTDSGKFTTNFYTLTYHTGKETDRDNLIINRYDALGLEVHSALFGLGYSHPLKGRYGFIRINGNWLYNIAHAVTDPVDNNKKNFLNWQRLQLDFEFIVDKYDNYAITDVKKRLNVNLKYYYQFPFMQNVSILAGAGYRGQDDYNILFQDSYPYVIIGLAAGLSFNVHR
jgi:hypothetical protein